MRFSIASAAMNGEDAVLRALDQIMSRVEDEIHVVDIVDTDELDITRWFKSCRDDRKKLLQEIAKQGIYESPPQAGPHSKTFSVHVPTDAETARNLANTSLEIVVENTVSDAALVRAAIRAFGSGVTVDLVFGRGQRVDPPAVRISAGGGFGEVPKLVRLLLGDAERRKRPPRVVAVTDSDGEWVGDIKKHARDIQSECAAANVPCAILSKRTAENYVPDLIWDRWAAGHKKVSAAVGALKGMTGEQRDHVRLDSTGKSPWATDSPQAAALFAGVSQQSYDALLSASMKGKGDGMAVLALEKYPEAATASDLLSRDATGDLQGIVKLIEDEL